MILSSAFSLPGPGTTTLPVKIYSSVRMGVSLQVNALSTLMLATVFLLTAAFRLLRAGAPGRPLDFYKEVGPL